MATKKEAGTRKRSKPTLRRETLKDLTPRRKAKKVKGGVIGTTACGRHYTEVVI
jgi:hypothetical protein